MQNRQRALPRGIARWCDQAYQRLLARVQGGGPGSAGAVAPPRAGESELEAVHACAAQTLGKLQKLFGDRLAAKAREATMYPDLATGAPPQVNMEGLTASLLGKVAG